jgi:hypothetical protein
MTKSGGMVYLLGRVEISIVEITKEILEMDMDKWFGATEAIIKDNGVMVFKMVKDRYLLLMKVIKKVDLWIIK